MNVEIDIIEAAKGYVAEIGLAKSWTCYSKVYPTREKAQEEAEALCDKNGWKVKQVNQDNED